MPESVRPEVEKSWLRSRSINPWAPRPQPISDFEFNKLLNKNTQMVKIAKPIMQYMYATNSFSYEDNFINLSEKSGVVLEYCTRLCSFPSPHKKRISESTLGTCITGIVLVEQMPMELGGAEQYSMAYQSNYGGGAPIKDSNGDLLGVILLYNNYGKIPKQPLEFVATAALLIGDLLENERSTREKPVETTELFTKMINYIDDYILIVNNQGQIVNVNDKCTELLAVDRADLLGKSCHEYNIDLKRLISDDAHLNKDIFAIKTRKQSYNCLLENNKTVKWLNNEEHTLLLFSTVNAPAVRVRKVHPQGEIDSFEKIIGKSSSHDNLINIAKRASIVDANVLLDGETGTGKEVFARAIHNDSSRALKPFIPINCGSIPKEILQSELFGYTEGAFTGGKKGGQVGKFEAADGGTIFLDEIGEMPIEMQVSLLRFLQDKNVIRLGENRGKKVNVRVIAATNRNLRSLVAEGLFREDLFYRLHVIHITLPPLRDRKDDILIIADYYIEHFADLYNLGSIILTQHTKNYLYQYNWPGNIRELANVIENAVIFSENHQITPDLLPVEILEYQPGLSEVNGERLRGQEKEVIRRALIEAKGNISNAASSIGISRNTLYRKIDKYGLQSLK